MQKIKKTSVVWKLYGIRLVYFSRKQHNLCNSRTWLRFVCPSFGREYLNCSWLIWPLRTTWELWLSLYPGRNTWKWPLLNDLHSFKKYIKIFKKKKIDYLDIFMIVLALTPKRLFCSVKRGEFSGFIKTNLVVPPNFQLLSLGQMLT